MLPRALRGGPCLLHICEITGAAVRGRAAWEGPRSGAEAENRSQERPVVEPEQGAAGMDVRPGVLWLHPWRVGAGHCRMRSVQSPSTPLHALMCVWGVGVRACARLCLCDTSVVCGPAIAGNLITLRASTTDGLP